MDPVSGKVTPSAYRTIGSAETDLNLSILGQIPTSGAVTHEGQ